MSGTIPTEISLLSNLGTFLVLQNEYTRREYPQDNATHSIYYSYLDELLLQVNRLSGTIPSEIGMLSKLGKLLVIVSRDILQKRLVLLFSHASNYLLLHCADDLRLQANKLTGTIPSTIASLNLSKLLRLVGFSCHSFALLLNLNHRLIPIAFLGLWSNQLMGPFTCPDHIEYCDVSCTTTDVGAQPNPACRVLEGKQEP